VFNAQLNLYFSFIGANNKESLKQSIKRLVFSSENLSEDFI